jgi:DNA-binding transcriptional MerR regulator
MYRIGEFSKIVGITTKTLRYYDAEGILSPTYRDKETGYRLYSETDIEKASIIADMRKFNFTISEMKDALRGIKTQDDFNDYLCEKIAITREQIDHYTQLISDIQEHLKQNLSTEEPHFRGDYTVSEVAFPGIKVAALRFKGQYHEIGQYYERLYKIVKNRASGMPVTCYYTLEYSDPADIEVCVPVTENVISDNVTTKKLFCDRALKVVHVGDYDKLNFAYRALFNFANEHCLTYTTPLIEIYKKGYGTTMAGNPQKYVTEIYLPVVKKSSQAIKE